MTHDCLGNRHTWDLTFPFSALLALLDEAGEVSNSRGRLVCTTAAPPHKLSDRCASGMQRKGPKLIWEEGGEGIRPVGGGFLEEVTHLLLR